MNAAKGPPPDERVLVLAPTPRDADRSRTVLVRAVRAALRARRRQYQVRDHLAALKDAERRKDEFLAMLAHELRNPLAPIRNGLRVLGLRPNPDPVAAQVAAMMERQVSHM